MIRSHNNTLALLALLLSGSSAFLTPSTNTCSFITRSTASLQSTAADDEGQLHPAVEGWPEKYSESGGDPNNTSANNNGPRVLSLEFDVHAATESELSDLDVKHWPTWTTGDKPKWAVGNQVADKEMPYGELSYMISGKLEIIPQSTGIPVVVNAGDLVTFPEGFVASWKVLEELTWHYYLY